MLLGDDMGLRRIRMPWVTWGLAGVIVLCFWAQLLGAAEVERGVFDPAAFAAAPADPSILVTLVSHVFVHANLLHLAINLVALLVFGDNIEDAFGHARFLAGFLLAATLGALLHAAMDAGALAGASAGVAGLMAAYLLIWPRAKLVLLALGGLPMLVPACWYVGLWLVADVLITAMTPEGQTCIAWYGHLGGFATGIVLVAFLRPREVGLFQPPSAPSGLMRAFRHFAYDLAPRPDGTAQTSGAAFGLLCRAMAVMIVLFSLMVR